MNEKIVSPQFIDLSDALARTSNLKYIQLILDHVKHFRYNVDTFTQVRMCEEIIKIIKNYKSRDTKEKNKLVADAKTLVIDILSESIIKPVTVATYYRELGYLDDELTDEQIRERIMIRLHSLKENKG